MALFKDRLRELRKQKGYSQQELADKINVTKQTISQYERGVREPDYDNLLALCDIFNVSAGYLLGKEDVTMRFLNTDELQMVESGYYLNPETAQIAQEIFDDPYLHALFDAARGTKPEDMKMAADMLSRFKETNPDG